MFVNGGSPSAQVAPVRGFVTLIVTSGYSPGCTVQATVAAAHGVSPGEPSCLIAAIFTISNLKSPAAIRVGIACAPGACSSAKPEFGPWQV